LAFVVGFVLLTGAGVWLLWADPFELLRKPAAQPTEVVRTAPAAPAPEAPAPAPVVAAKPSVPLEQQPIVAADDDPFEAIRFSPGDGDADTATRNEPGYVPQNPAYMSQVNNLVITGARTNDSGGVLMFGGQVFRAGEVVDKRSGLVFEGFADGVLTFRDPSGATYTRRF
jgi:hypothetical protein